MFSILLLSCLHKPIAPVQRLELYSVKIQAEFQNIDDPTKDLDAFDLELRLGIQPLDRFPDDSVSFVVTVEESQALFDGKEVSLGVDGKWVHTRAFEFGELLTIEHMQDWAEESLYIDSFDILWFVLYPNPPNLEKGQTKPSLARYPLRSTEKHQGRAQFRSDWTLISAGRKAQLRYESKMDLKGTWNGLEQVGSGQIKGEVSMGYSGGIPEKHSGVFSREICYKGLTSICQMQNFVFQMEKL